MTCIPEHVREIMNTLESGGFKAWLVGGCLRDMLLDRTVHDWDVATSAAARNQIDVSKDGGYGCEVRHGDRRHGERTRGGDDAPQRRYVQ